MNAVSDTGNHTCPVQHVEVDSSHVASERISGVRCRKLRHYSIFPFLLSLFAYSELTEVKMFTSINLALSLHCANPGANLTPLCRIEPNREF